jgi:hypothetical protein
MFVIKNIMVWYYVSSKPKLPDIFIKQQSPKFKSQCCPKTTKEIRPQTF